MGAARRKGKRGQVTPVCGKREIVSVNRFFLEGMNDGLLVRWFVLRPADSTLQWFDEELAQEMFRSNVAADMYSYLKVNCYMGHATMENRHGLAVAGVVTLADGTAERRASQIMLEAKAKEAGRRITVGEDKAYDTAGQSPIRAPSTSRRM